MPICVFTDNYTVKTTLQENFPTVHIVFTPTITNIDNEINEQTNGTGFDLVLDFSSSLQQ
jgi:hypothetical protein